MEGRMSDLEAYIWHDEAGQIIAVGHVVDSEDLSVEPVTQEGQSVLRARLPERVLANLHLTHRIDCERGELVELRQADQR